MRTGADIAETGCLRRVFERACESLRRRKAFGAALAGTFFLSLSLVSPATAASEQAQPGTNPSNQPAIADALRRGDANRDRIEDALGARLAGAAQGESFDVIVVFEGANAVARSRAAAGPFAVTREFSIINGFQAALTAQQIRGISRAPGLFRISEVMTVEAHDIPSNDDMGATNARIDFGVDGSGVSICVVDTGIAAGHEQFDTKGPGGGPLTALEFHDAINGQPAPYDDHGHGTHVAGSAAGDGTGGSIYAADGIGVATGARLLAAKVLNASGQGTDPQVISGIEWCADRADIVSMSLGAGPTDGNDAMSLAVNCVADPSGPTCTGTHPPRIVVISAGNSGAQSSTIGSPGVAEKAITVGAAAEWSGDPADLWQDDGLYLNSFSSRGPVVDGSGNFIRIKPDIVGPGSRVHSAAINNANLAPYGSAPNQYATLSGTSMSTPYVSGVIALMLEADPSLAVADAGGLPHQKVRAILAATAHDLGAPGKDNEWGDGVIDAYSAVAEAAGQVSYTTNAYPGYTRQAGQSVADFGDWTHEFTITADLVGRPVAGTAIIDGALTDVCLLPWGAGCLIWGQAWSPDLEVAIERRSGGNSWSPVSPASGEVTLSECPSSGECGQAGRAEVVHFTPLTTGTYRFRVFPAEDDINQGLGGNFDFEVSLGAPAPGGGNGIPLAGFTASCNDATLACSFTDTSTDADGSIVGWSWDFGDSGTSTAQNPSHSYASAGAYTVTLTVTDDSGATDSHAVLVTPGTNLPPEAAFSFSTSDLTASFTDSSTDADGTIVSWSWNFGDGSPASTVEDPSHSYAAEGTYNVTLTVTDNEGGSDSVTQPVTVTEPVPNTPPVASFTVDRDPCGTDFFPNKCQFTDTSTDSDGSIVSWEWTFENGTGSGLPIAPGHQMLVQFGNDVNPVTVTLTVTDNNGATHTKSIELPISHPVTPNDPPVATITAPAPGATYDSGAEVTFTGTASDTEDGDVSASLAWSSSIDGAIGTGASVSTSSLSAGTHTITATATDSGARTGTDTVSITVNPPPNAPPTVTVTAPPNGTTYTAGALVSFTGTATDAEDGTITAALTWTSSLDGVIGSGGGFSTTALSVGTHTVTASVTDAGGLPGSAAVTVTVNAANTAPSASITAPANGSTFTEGASVTFTGSASDAQDGPLTAALAWSSNLDGPIGTGGSFSTTGLSVGTHTVTAAVTDSGGLAGSAAVTVTVNPANTAPSASITAPANGSVFAQGASVSFAGTASDAEDGPLTAALSWTSSRDGGIGTGGSFATTGLSVGTHTITASVTDSGGLGDTDQVTVTVEAASTTTIAHIGDLDDLSVAAPRNRWDARVDALVLSSGGAPVAGAMVSGTWSGGGSGSCTTGADGRCLTPIAQPNLKGNVTTATFTVSSITGTDIAYQAGANADPDGDSNGTVIVATMPAANQPPGATISSPGDGASFGSGASVGFAGTASDPEEGDLTGALSWTSSLDGAIGSGGAFSATLRDGTHTITASVTDSNGATGSASVSVTVGSAPPPPPADITLGATGYKVKGLQTVDLTWSGTAAANVDIYRNGALIRTVGNTGSHTDNIGLKGGGTYSYQVCEAGSSTCSNTAGVVF